MTLAATHESANNQICLMHIVDIQCHPAFHNLSYSTSYIHGLICLSAKELCHPVFTATAKVDNCHDQRRQLCASLKRHA